MVKCLSNLIIGMRMLNAFASDNILWVQIESDAHFIDNEPICCISHKRQTIRYETHKDLLIAHQFKIAHKTFDFLIQNIFAK